MTTYAFTLVLDDSEIGMLEAALKLMIKNCSEHPDYGVKPPYMAHKHSAENVLSRLHERMEQTSFNNFS
jgi:hypothetical protein